MTLYVDSSAFARRYLTDEPGRDACLEAMNDDPDWITSRLTLVEVHRALSIASSRTDARVARAEFDGDLAYTALIDVDTVICQMAIDIAVETHARSLDALHIASALRAGGSTPRLLTCDHRQAAAARQLGITVMPT